MYCNPTLVTYKSQVKDIFKQMEQYEYEQKCPLRAIVPLNQIKQSIQQIYNNRPKVEEKMSLRKEQQPNSNLYRPRKYDSTQGITRDLRENNVTFVYVRDSTPSVCMPYRGYTRHSCL